MLNGEPSTLIERNNLQEVHLLNPGHGRRASANWIPPFLPYNTQPSSVPFFPLLFLSFPFLSFHFHVTIRFSILDDWEQTFIDKLFLFFFFFFFFQWNRNAKRWRNFSKNQRDIHERFVYYHRLAICFEIWKRSWLTFDKYYFSSFAFYRLWNNTCWKRFYPAVRYSWNKFRSTELLEFRNYFPVSSCRKFLKSRRLSWMNWPLWIYLMK